MTTLTKRVLKYTHQEDAAWHDYLQACTHAHPLSYEEVETWAWQRLQRQLKALRRKKATPSQPTKTGG